MFPYEAPEVRSIRISRAIMGRSREVDASAIMCHSKDGIDYVFTLITGIKNIL